MAQPTKKTPVGGDQPVGQEQPKATTAVAGNDDLVLQLLERVENAETEIKQMRQILRRLSDRAGLDGQAVGLPEKPSIDRVVMGGPPVDRDGNPLRQGPTEEELRAINDGIHPDVNPALRQ